MASDLALLRYQAISAYISLDPPRGRRGAMLEQLSRRTWTLPDGRQVQFAAETLRSWVRRYRRGGLAALEDKPRPRRGVQTLDAEQIELVCRLKRDVPARSLDRIIEIAEETKTLPKGLLTRSTLHRILVEHDLSRRPTSAASIKDLDRFEAVAPNDLWQSDMLAGPWLPDPERPGKHRRAWLYAFLDDHSRLLLAGRFSFKGHWPALELVFREAIRRYGVPGRVYYDNGAVYRSRAMKQVCGALGIHGIVYTEPNRPEGHGKIEAFNRLCRAAFLAEVEASAITNLEGLNRAFRAWLDRCYNTRLHSEIGATPRERWRAGVERVRHVDERALVEAFLWREQRTPDKAGVLSLMGTRYQVGPRLAKKKVEVRYDPERLDQIDIWYDGTFQERVGPLVVGPNRRPKPKQEPAPASPSEKKKPVVDWLGHLVEAHDEAPTVDEVHAALEARRREDDAVVDLLRDRLVPEAFDGEAARRFLDRYGPLKVDQITEAVELAIEVGGADQHVSALLRTVLDAVEAA